MHPDFGDLATMDRLIAEAHQRGIRIILDFVPNHTSSQHPWFLESRSSTDSPKRDWYVWRDAKPEGSPPNNWIAAFGGPAWEWDQKTQQYYLHSFLVEQPDLNWRNPEVEQAHARRAALLDGARRRRLPHRRDGPHRQGPGAARQPAAERTRRCARRFGQTALQLHTHDQNWPDIIDAVREIRSGRRRVSRSG